MSDNDDFQDMTISLEADGKPMRLLRPGDVVGGHYTLKSIIGRGGMGLVFLAEHRGLNKLYALKALAPERSSETNWQRFKNEGIAIGRLDHPNIVKVYDMGVDGSDCLYYVMDLLEGMPLSEYIKKKGVLDISETLTIFEQLCSGLGYAHKRGLIHRDIKPNNIILCKPRPGQPSVQAKIIDFGLVKLVGQDSYMQQAQTKVGLVCGSPLYMSPEQCRGSRLDERSDLYSLGCTLFECLTGEPPFCGKNGMETAYMHENSKVPTLNDYRPDKKYPENLESVVSRMLEKMPGKRYQTAEQIAQDLDRVRRGQSVNREAINIRSVDPEADEDDQDTDPGSIIAQRETRTLLMVALAGLIIIGLVGWAAFHLLTGNTKMPLSTTVYTQTSFTKEQIGVREIFDNWPSVSSGIVEKNNRVCRLFTFPPVAVGILYWGGESGQHELAKGEVQVPPDKPLTLQLPRPEGLYTRLFPHILTKFRPDDICSLEVKEPQIPLADTVILSDVSPELINSIKGWTALRKLDFYHCNLKPETMAALNQLHPVEELRLHNATYDPKALLKVKWLDQVNILDIKNCSDVDIVLHRLGTSEHLYDLSMDLTSPTVKGLADLSACKSLRILNVCECELTSPMIAEIAKIENLQELNFGNSDIVPGQFPLFGKMKNLRKISLPYFDGPDLAKLRAILPHTTIVLGRRQSFRM